MKLKIKKKYLNRIRHEKTNKKGTFVITNKVTVFQKAKILHRIVSIQIHQYYYKFFIQISNNFV